MTAPNWDYSTIPAHTMEGLLAWVATAQPVGDFLYAILTNDLYEAVGRADVQNEVALPIIVRWLFNKAPNACWGSPELVRDWKGMPS